MTTKTSKKNPYKLDAYERGILASYNRGEWKPVKNMRAEMKRYQAYAQYTLAKRAKNRRVNIRLPWADIQAMQARAIEEGIPYQTLMASVLHKYLTGRLVEKR